MTKTPKDDAKLKLAQKLGARRFGGQSQFLNYVWPIGPGGAMRLNAAPAGGLS
jgi:hypothetical protein